MRAPTGPVRFAGIGRRNAASSWVACNQFPGTAGRDSEGDATEAPRPRKPWTSSKPVRYRDIRIAWAMKLSREAGKTLSVWSSLAVTTRWPSGKNATAPIPRV